MKRCTLIVFLILVILNIQAQDFLISFSGSGASTIVEKIKIENLTQGTFLTLPGNTILHLKGDVSVQKSGKNQDTSIASKSNISEIIMPYTYGDRLKFIGTSGNYSAIVMNTPRQSKKLIFNFTECTDGSLINYPVIQIGSQTWMAENLKTSKFNDGTAIPYVYLSSYFSPNYKPAYCVYRNSVINYNTYGGLYDWGLVWTEKICPTGWHVPSIDEWLTLFDYLGGASKAGNILKEKGIKHWTSPNTGAIDSVGFCALPGGVNLNEGEGHSNIG
ncbi:MAG: fibrobacter succinogenes major paralogous domain-containing protein, partial [Mariniphaga sp.]|nr:fibrobacter succinogenes major paralogous domain-containing protein [Mariniphaga sp.]